MTAYIEHRLRVAGASNPNLFEPEALEAMFRWSKGVARLVNIICDRALLVGYVEDARIIDREKVESAFSDLHIEPDAEIGGSFQVEAPADNRMLMRVASRLDAVEEKLDLLLQVLARAGLAETGARRIVSHAEMVTRAPRRGASGKRRPRAPKTEAEEAEFLTYSNPKNSTQSRGDAKAQSDEFGSS